MPQLTDAGATNEAAAEKLDNGSSGLSTEQQQQQHKVQQEPLQQQTQQAQQKQVCVAEQQQTQQQQVRVAQQQQNPMQQQHQQQQQQTQFQNQQAQQQQNSQAKKTITIEMLYAEIVYQRRQQSESSITIQKLVSEIINLKKINEEFLNAINELKGENKMLSERVDTLECKVHRLEQDKLNRKVDVIGVPNVTNENALEIATKILSDALSIDTARENITNCYVKSVRKLSEAAASNNSAVNDVNKNNVLTIEFSSTAFKKKVLLGKKNNYVKLNASLFDNNNTNKIYINESLTSYYRALHLALKKYKKDNKFKYLWYNDARFLLRESENSKVVAVDSFVAFEKFKSVQNKNKT